MLTLTDKAADLEKSVHSLKRFFAGAGAVIIVLAGVIGWWVSQELMPAVHSMQGTLSAHTDTLSAHTDTLSAHTDTLHKVNDALQVLKEQQPKSTQKLIQDLLGAAQTTTSPTIATSVVIVVNSLIAGLKDEKSPADQEYFKTIVLHLNSLAGKTSNPTVTKAIHAARLSLAEYNSALQPEPQTGASIIVSRTMEHALSIIQSPNATVRGGRFDFRKVTGNAIVVKESPNILFDNDIIEGGNQLLDGIKWHTVTFVGTHISYHGGYTELENVRFVNCTFDVPPQNTKGQQFLEMATLNLPKFVG